MKTLTLARHLILHPGEALPPYAVLYDYVLAGNGVFIRARRKGVQACVPIGLCDVRGLPALEPSVELTLPKVPADLTQELLEMALAERTAGGKWLEAMYHLSWSGTGWELVKPAQRQYPDAVEPVGPYAGTTYATYLVEVHSHHTLDCHWFSATDDASEGTKFRFFGLLFDLTGRPRLSLRLNVYGYSWDVPAATVFELPEGLNDGYTADEPLEGEVHG
jgi:hypothetical protein